MELDEESREPLSCAFCEAHRPHSEKQFPGCRPPSKVKMNIAFIGRTGHVYNEIDLDGSDAWKA